MPDFSNPLAKIDYGRDFNFFKKMLISSVTFGTNCDVIIPFSSYSVIFHLEGLGNVQYSFNGYTIHGDMIDGYASETMTFTNRTISKIWFKGDGYIRVEAWGIR